MDSEQPVSTNPLVNRFLSQKGKVEDFIRQLPIIGEAYKNNEYYKADQFIRDEIEKKLRDGRTLLQNVSSKLARKGLNVHLQQIEYIQQKLETLLNKVKSAGHGINGMGSGFKPTSDQMDELLQYDQNLYGKAELFEGEAKSLVDTIKDLAEDVVEEKADSIIAFLESVITDLEERRRVIIQLAE